MSIKIALAGNPNCGKTTLFNALTGSNQYVGNWPGVTVEKKEGKLKSNKDVIIMDLPGIYSLSPYTLEEVVARNYLITERPDAILNIIDGTNLERNLYLTTQLTELGIPVVIAINMLDVLEKKGDIINIQELSKKIGCPVYEISALKGKGIQEAADAVVKFAKENKKFEVAHVFAKNVEDILENIAEKLPKDIPEEQKRFYAIKLFERDSKILETREDFPDIESIIADAENEFDDDSESIITNERYTYISSIIKGCYKKKSKEKLSTSDKIDRIVTNRWLALPIFAIIMIIVYYVSVTSVGSLVTDFTNDQLFGEDGWYLFGIGRSDYDAATDKFVEENIFNHKTEMEAELQKAVDEHIKGSEEILAAVQDEDFDAFEEAMGSYSVALESEGIDISEYYNDDIMENAPDKADYGVYIPGITTLVSNGLEAINCVDWLSALIVDGIVGGVGAVLGFVPQMLVLFIFLAFLEYCGYMARIAFIMDRIFRKFGLSGKSFIPILIGTGCGVPGIMASRTIENDRDRKMTIMTTTFIPCGAKLPIIAMIATALFDGAWWVAPSAYFLGIAAIIISGIILKKTKMFAGDPAPFVMELPAYHLPTVGSILRSMWERGWSFIKRAGTVILLASIIIWAGSSFGMVDGSFGFSTEMELNDSVLGMIGNAICWIFAPLGFGEATATIATIMGLVAKEEVVGVFGVLDFEGLGALAGYAFLAFNLLCAPCFAAIGAIKREMNSAKWTWFAIGYQCTFAYATALVIYQLGMLFSGHFDVFTIIGSIVAFAIIAFVIYLLVRPYKESTKFTQKVKINA
ncbi:ferrous iron transporter B [Pseudoruminococcus massiliensis]|uniref:ferrous iron transporter B n=1 Tax=Pseudoruminococcus massiliensis TaxID=2086583 RepID=UPI000D0FF43F|nr:ferrous iron transporter B [Pseudoruminococcus massiliensis]